ncbi:hypothetical protein DTO280E4_2956 [Paecilomyces variotii]|nr:hypothetical protein DTO195F2_7649 [Paecilomyces variotii]KAJ9363207.1 hypothetical protein DTO280E4_2956 [Paecilomyces variotii]KAJ9372318.1 hypothetical protein DTO282E5_2905 [Paecilomyces variotii]
MDILYVYSNPGKPNSSNQTEEREAVYLAKPPSISASHPTSYSPAGKTRFSAERYFQQCATMYKPFFAR